MPKDYYIQPDAPDLILSEERVLSLVCQHVPGGKAVTAIDETGGEEVPALERVRVNDGYDGTSVSLLDPAGGVGVHEREVLGILFAQI